MRDVLIPRSRLTDPATSHAAAHKAKAFAWSHRDRILGAMWRPMHCYDIAKLTGIDHVGVARRMSELCKLELVRDTGGTAKGPNGLDCTLWEKVICKD